MLEVIIAILLIILFFVIFIFVKVFKMNSKKETELFNANLKMIEQRLEVLEDNIKDDFQRSRQENREVEKGNREELRSMMNTLNSAVFRDIKEMKLSIKDNFGDFSLKQRELSELNHKMVKELNLMVGKSLEEIRDRNSTKLEEIRKTVDDKLHLTLEKKLGDSFNLVSKRLEEVHKGLGEMQNLATGVGDLKKVLSNVKTRGILGEYQLENILMQILTVEQYSKNVATKRGSQANVEFAVKLPGQENDKFVWLPIDSKFPLSVYNVLLNAYENGIKEDIENATKNLIRRLESFAVDIKEKYLDPPNTTDFAIMFLPVESLYGEVLRHVDLFEKLQKKYRVTVTGPTTLSAFLNSLQMGFRTLAVQKRSSEVWEVLQAVKTEFLNFGEHLEKLDKQLNTASNTLGILKGRRFNAVNRKLKDISSIESLEAKKLLEIE